MTLPFTYLSLPSSGSYTFGYLPGLPPQVHPPECTQYSRQDCNLVVYLEPLYINGKGSSQNQIPQLLVTPNNMKSLNSTKV